MQEIAKEKIYSLFGTTLSPEQEAILIEVIDDVWCDWYDAGNSSC